MNFPVFANKEVGYGQIPVIVIVHLIAYFYPGLAVFTGHHNTQGEGCIWKRCKEIVLLLLGNATHYIVVKFDGNILKLLGLMMHHSAAYPQYGLSRFTRDFILE